MTSHDDPATTADADPLAAEADNGEKIPDPSADDPIEEARRRADELEASVDEPPVEPTPPKAPHEG